MSEAIALVALVLSTVAELVSALALASGAVEVSVLVLSAGVEQASAPVLASGVAVVVVLLLSPETSATSGAVPAAGAVVCSGPVSSETGFWGWLSCGALASSSDVGMLLTRSLAPNMMLFEESLSIDDCGADP